MSTSSPMIPGDVILLPFSGGRWLMYNVFSRTSLVLSTEALRVLADLSAPAQTTTNSKSVELYTVWSSEYFSNHDGLLADPTRIIRTADLGEGQKISSEELLKLLLKHSLLVVDKAAYKLKFSKKTSLLDSEHFGNFHQQLGQHLMLEARQNPEEWWLKQKFTADFKDVNQNLYNSIEKQNLIRYFQKRFTKGDTVVDLGCGTGFFSDLMAAAGAAVHGIDTNPRYIEIAKKNAAHGAKFSVAQLGKAGAGAMSEIEDHSADFVFMSDALLFYFVSPDPTITPDIKVLLDDIKRILKPNGTFISVESHFTFWLAPWFGDIDRPFTVLSEYLNRTFAVNPPMSTFIQTFARNGFAVHWMEEFTPDTTSKNAADRGTVFAQQFPLWQLFEFKL